jgi:glucosamine kinase
MGNADKRLFFGVDGGGSGCRVAVCDGAGNRIGEVSGGPANVTSDRSQAIANICDAIAQLARIHAISEEVLCSSVGHAGLAGVISKADEQAVAAALPFAMATVTDDRETALIGALEDTFGVLAALGTGTIIAVRKASGVRTFGGWGLQISDQASGAWLGREALRRCVLAQDGLVEHSDLTRALLSQHGGELTSMVEFALTATPKDYAANAPLVVESAQGGDANGLRLMQKGAAYLTACFDAADLEASDVVCLSGGVGPYYATYLDDSYRSRVRAPLGTPLDGALRLAMRQNRTSGAAI